MSGERSPSPWRCVLSVRVGKSGAGRAWAAAREHRLAPGGLAGVGTEQHGQPGDGLLVVFPAAADIADPGREIRHGDQLVAQPGKVGNVLQAHDACLALVTGQELGRWVGDGDLSHNDYYGAAAAICTWLIIAHSGGGQ